MTVEEERVIDRSGYSPDYVYKKHSAPNRRGHNRYTYDGLNYSYEYAHKLVRVNYGKASRCTSQTCDGIPRRFEWANISHEYKLDIIDWRQLCRSCHAKFDITEDTIKKNRAAAMGNTFRRKTIIQKDLEGNVIKYFPSSYAAELELGILHTAIANNMSGRAKTAGGFVWERT